MVTIFKAGSDRLADGKWAPNGIVRELQDRHSIREWSPSPTEKTFDTKDEADALFEDYCLNQGWQKE